MPTSLGTYVGAPSASHTVSFSAPTAGRDVFVAVTAAALITTSDTPWVRVAEASAFNAGAIFRLAGSDNDGSISSIDVALSGARQAAAAVWEDPVTGTITYATDVQSGYLTGTTIVGGPYTATAGVAVYVVHGTNGAADVVVPPVATGYSGGFVGLVQSTGTAAADEDSATYVAVATDVALSGVDITATYAGSWSHTSVTILVAYEVSSAPTVTGTVAVTVPAMTATVVGGDLATVAVTVPATTATVAGVVEVPGTVAVTVPATTGTVAVDDAETPGTAVYTVKQAILSRLRTLAATDSDPLWGFNILDGVPVRKDDLRGPTGYTMIVYPTSSDGTVEVSVFTGGWLRFDETSTLTLRIEVIGRTSEDTQPQMDVVAGRALRHVMAEISRQQAWDDRVALGLDRYDFLWFVPSEVDTISTRVEGIPAAGAGISLGVRISARHSYGG